MISPGQGSAAKCCARNVHKCGVRCALPQLSLGLLWVPGRPWCGIPLLHREDPTRLDTKVLKILARLSFFLSEYQTRQASDKMGAACFRRLRGFAKCFQASQLLFS